MWYEVTQIKQNRRHRIIHKWVPKLSISDISWHLTIIKCFGLKVCCHTQGTKQNDENEEICRQQDYAWMQCSSESIISSRTKSKGLPTERAEKNVRLLGVLGSQETRYALRWNRCKKA